MIDHSLSANTTKGAGGFTLVEVLVAFVILSITLVVTLNLFITILGDRPAELRAQQVTRIVGAVLDDIASEVRVSELVEYSIITDGGYTWREIRLHHKEDVNGRAATITAYRWKVDAPHDFYKITDQGTSDEEFWTILPANVQLEQFAIVFSNYTHPRTGLRASTIRIRLNGVHTEALPGEEGGLVQTTLSVRTI